MNANALFKNGVLPHILYVLILLIKYSQSLRLYNIYYAALLL